MRWLAAQPIPTPPGRAAPLTECSPLPLFDLSYQRYSGPRTSRLSRIVTLAALEAKLLIKQRRFLGLMALCWVPAILRGGQIYVARQFPQAQEFMRVDAALWQEFLTQQVSLLFLLILGLYVGAAAIAEDFRSGILTMYLSKPFSRTDYLFAKMMPVFASLGLITVVPSLFLLALHLGFAGELSLLRENPLLPIAILGYGTWLSAYFGLAILAMSSLSRSGRLAGAGIVMLMLGSEFLQVALRGLRLGEKTFNVSLIGYARDAGHLFFGNVGAGDNPTLSVIAMSAIIVVSVIVILRRLQTVEVTS